MKKTLLTRGILRVLLVLGLTFVCALWGATVRGTASNGSAIAVASGTTGDIAWTLYDNGEFVLAGEGATAEYTTSSNPSTPPWYSNTEYRQLIQKVVVEEGVTRLGARLFYGATNLSEVVFADNSTLAEIGEGVFRGCTSLTTITLPDSLTSLGRVCFYGDTALETVIINGTMTTLPDQLFDNCDELTSVSIPGTVTTLSAKSSNANVTTFYGITDKLTSIHFGGTINSWKRLLANGNSEPLKNVNITVTCSDGIYIYSSDIAAVVASGTTGDVTWTLYNNGEFVLSGNGATAEYTTSSDPSTPPWYRTEEHKLLIEKVIIEDGVTRLGARLFYGCTNLSEVDFLNNNTLVEIGDGVFRGCSSLTEITLPDSLTSLGRVCFYGCSNLESIVFGGADSNLTALYDQTITNCSKLTTITLPASITTFGLNDGKGPFYNSTTVLDTIHYYGTIGQWQTLLENTYSAEIKLSSIIVYCTDGVYIDGSLGNGIVYSLDEGVLTLRAQLGAAAIPDFNSTSDLPWASDAATVTKVIVRNGITGIGANVFANCVNITEVVYIGDEAGWNLIEENSGENNDPLFNVTPIFLVSGKCGDNVTFTYDAATKCLTISGTGGTYDYASGTATPWGVIRDEIETVIVAEGITYLGDYLFNRAGSLSSVTLPEGLLQIEVSTFGNCTSLEEVVFRDGLKIVGSKAFGGCSGLETLTLPGTVEAIDMKAFSGATSLTDVYYNGTEGDWNQIVISTQAQGNKYLLNANIHYLKSVQIFTDAEIGSVFYDAVTYLTDNGFLTVVADTFGVADNADKNMLFEILYENAGSPGMYESAMDWAACNSLVDNTVNEEISLSELATFLYRTALLNQQVTADTQEDETTAALAWCTSQQYFTQVDTSDHTMTRGEVALIMTKYLQSEASDADRSDEQFALLRNALSATGGDGKFYIYAPDISVEDATTKSGDCVFILFPDGQTMLIDTAIYTTESIVLKMLDDLGVTALDHLMFSHSDRDHVGNGVAVVRHLNGNVGKIYLNNASQTVYDEIVAEAKSDVEIAYLRRGDVFMIGAVAARVFNPSNQFINDYNAGLETQNNNSSIVVKFTYGESTFLTGGDLYELMELELVDLYGDELQADVLKSNHHGAYTSDCDEWVDTVNPVIMFAETDDNGNTKLVNRAAEKEIAYYTFGMDGSILISMDNNRNYNAITQRDSVLRREYTGEIGKSESEAVCSAE